MSKPVHIIASKIGFRNNYYLYGLCPTTAASAVRLSVVVFWIYLLFLSLLLNVVKSSSVQTSASSSFDEHSDDSATNNNSRRHLPLIRKSLFGTLNSTGERVYKFTITNANAAASFIEYGARWIEMSYADKSGRRRDNVLLAFDDLPGNVNDSSAYMGAIVGRYGMRMFPPTVTLDGKAYTLDENRPGVSLHGGTNAFDKKVWHGQIMPGGVLFERISEDGENGYPGRLHCAVMYQLSDRNEVIVDVSAELVEDGTKDSPKSTVVNIFNHAYFNLGGQSSLPLNIYDHKIAIHSDTTARYSTKTAGIPEDLVPVETMPKLFDLRQLDNHLTEDRLKSAELEASKGYDNSYLLQRVDAARAADKKPAELKHAATVVHPASGRNLEVYTTQPFIHLYAGGFLDLTTTRGRVFGNHAGFCLETCLLGNAPNNKNFPSAVLRQGETYAHRSIYRFGIVV